MHQLSSHSENRRPIRGNQIQTRWLAVLAASLKEVSVSDWGRYKPSSMANIPATWLRKTRIIPSLFEVLVEQFKGIAFLTKVNTKVYRAWMGRFGRWCISMPWRSWSGNLCSMRLLIWNRHNETLIRTVSIYTPCNLLRNSTWPTGTVNYRGTRSVVTRRCNYFLVWRWMSQSLLMRWPHCPVAWRSVSHHDKHVDKLLIWVISVNPELL